MTNLRDQSVFIGWCFDIENAQIGLSLLGSPVEIEQELRKTEWSFKEVAHHIETGISATEVLGRGSDFTFSQGPHIPAFMQLMDFLLKSQFSDARRLILETPSLLEGDHDAAPIPLLAYSSLGKLDAVQFLLETGASPNRSRALGLGMSPLHWAAAQGHAEIVAALLKGNANPATENWSYLTAAHLAKLNDHANLAKTIGYPSPSPLGKAPKANDVVDAMIARIKKQTPN
jgi:hypothetical protein